MTSSHSTGAAVFTKHPPKPMSPILPSWALLSVMPSHIAGKFVLVLSSVRRSCDMVYLCCPTPLGHRKLVLRTRNERSHLADTKKRSLEVFPAWAQSQDHPLRENKRKKRSVIPDTRCR